jgi:hypothetical protein
VKLSVPSGRYAQDIIMMDDGAVDEGKVKQG